MLRYFKDEHDLRIRNISRNLLRRNNHTFEHKLVRGLPNEKDRKTFRLQCFPLYSILKAVGVVEIDFLSLDIEGGEFSVMNSLLSSCSDFKFNIATIETVHMGMSSRSKATLMEFDYMMKSKGYRAFKSLRLDTQYENINNGDKNK